MWAIDAGLKWKGLAINGQYYFRQVSDFTADSPLPLDSMRDHGFELSAAGVKWPYTSGLDGWVPMIQGILAF